MAENNLFGFAAPQSVVQPTTPNIQVTPNQQGSKAFASLAKLGGAVATRVQEQTKEQERIAQNAEYVATNNTAIAMYSQNKQAVIDAGNDLDKLEVLHNDYVSGIHNVKASISPENQAKMARIFSGLETGEVNTYTKQRNDIQVTNFEDNLQSVATTFMAHAGDPKIQLQIMEDQREEALGLGITRKEFGTDLSDAIMNNYKASADIEGAINNHDYSQIKALDATINMMERLDPKNTESLADARSFYTSTKNQVDAGVRSSALMSIAEQDGSKFANLMQLGMDEGVYSPEDVNLLKQRYTRNQLSGTRRSKELAQQAIDNNPKGLDLSTITDSTQNAFVKADIEKKAVAAYFNETPTSYAWLENMAKLNPKVMQAKFQEAFSQQIAEMTAIAASKAITPEERGQRTQALGMATEKLNTLKTKQFGLQVSAESANKEALIKAVTVSGDVDKLPAYLEAIREGGYDITPISISNSSVADMKESMTVRDFNEARKMVSALVAAGQPLEEAVEAIRGTYEYNDIDDEADAQVSNAVATSLDGAGVAAVNYKYLLPVLQDPNTFVGEGKEVIDAKIARVMEGTEVKVDIRNGSMFLSNAEGTTEQLVMPKAQLELLGKDMNAMGQDEDSSRESGLALLANNVSLAIGKQFSGIRDMLSEGGQTLATPAGYFADRLNSKTEALSKTIADGTQAQDKLLLDLIEGDKPAEESFKTYFAKELVNTLSFLHSYLGGGNAAYSDMKDKLTEIRGGFLTGDADTMSNKVGSILSIGLELLSNADKQPELDPYTPTTKGDKVDIKPSVQSIPTTTNTPSAKQGLSKKTVTDIRNSTSGYAIISPAYGSDKPGNQTINPVSNIPTETHYKNVIQGAESNHGSTPVVSNDGKLRDGKKTNDIGYGHKITDAEEKSGLIHGIPFGDNTPLTEANMQTIFDKDMAVNLTVARTSGWDATLKAMKPTKTWDDLDTKYQRVLASLAYNMGGKVASTFKKALTAAVDKNDVTFAKELRRMTTVAATATKKSYKKHTAGMDNRAMKELYAAGFITTQAEYDLYKKNLPLAKTASYNGMTL